MKIILTQKNRLKLPEYEMDQIRLLSFYSPRLYNIGLYSVRQYFFDNNKYLNYKSTNFKGLNEKWDFLQVLGTISKELSWG